MFSPYKLEASQLFDFSQDDLNENRLGRLSANQQQHLQTKVFTDLICQVILILIGVPIFGILIASKNWGFYAWITLGLFLLGAMGYTIYRSRMIWKWISEGSLEIISGVCTFDSMRISKFGRRLRYIRIGKIAFMGLSNDQIDYFVEGNSYRLFYLSMLFSRHIIALETVSTK